MAHHSSHHLHLCLLLLSFIIAACAVDVISENPAHDGRQNATLSELRFSGTHSSKRSAADQRHSHQHNKATDKSHMSEASETKNDQTVVKEEMDVESIKQKSEARGISKKIKPIEQSEGVGARVKRLIGNGRLRNLDPFLMMDHFDVELGKGGFPDHPHRGFCTLTYMLEGAFTHEDNRGNKGTITPGGLQYMVAGRGIVHSEMPEEEGHNTGIQLWINLPKDEKMIKAHWQDLDAEDVPVAKTETATIKVIAGTALDVEGPMKAHTPMMYLDARVKGGESVTVEVPSDHDGFMYVLNGSSRVEGTDLEQGEMGIFGAGNSVTVTSTDDEELRFLLIAGVPLNEPIVQYGPFVMNTQEEIYEAMMDYQSGKFSYE